MKEASKTWSAPTSWEEVCRRAAGRTRYNNDRALERELRQIEVEKLYQHFGGGYGSQAAIAHELKISEATVSRDLRDIREDLKCASTAICPLCRRKMN